MNRMNKDLHTVKNIQRFVCKIFLFQSIIFFQQVFEENKECLI